MLWGELVRKSKVDSVVDWSFPTGMKKSSRLRGFLDHMTSWAGLANLPNMALEAPEGFTPPGPAIIDETRKGAKQWKVNTSLSLHLAGLVLSTTKTRIQPWTYLWF